MSRWVACVVLLGFIALVSALDNFTMSVSPAPVPGQSFTITWTPDTAGNISLALGVYDTPDVFHLEEIATIPNTGSYVWQPHKGLCGKFFFSIGAGATTIYSTSPTFSIPCPTATPSPSPTSACSSSIPSPTGANPFLVPNANNYPVRVGEATNITWVPTTSGTTSIRAFSLVTNITTTIADKIPNSGSFTWTPSPDLPHATDLTTYGANYVLQIIDDASGTVTSTSPVIYILTPSHNSVFINVYEWADPVVGSPVTIFWNPSNATTISIDVADQLYSDPTQFTHIAVNVTNNGSFTWDVPANFTPGQYTVIASTLGNLFDDYKIIFISKYPPSPCSPSANGATSSSTAVTGTVTTKSTPIASATSGASSETRLNSSPAAISAILVLFHFLYLF